MNRIVQLIADLAKNEKKLKKVLKEKEALLNKRIQLIELLEEEGYYVTDNGIKCDPSAKKQRKDFGAF